jgi:hypothetical protein
VQVIPGGLLVRDHTGIKNWYRALRREWRYAMKSDDKKQLQKEFIRIGSMPDELRRKYLRDMPTAELHELARANSFVMYKVRRTTEFDIYLLSKVCWEQAGRELRARS